ncbi:hypothetical protein [Caenimonas sp. SL110]|uniref:hypothetical protein n=1 Tax=Caenimonas sp. SL110 TaxID=1450524 RepID=UPI000653A79D|nr:hypothetical protein [Caenimonas sp. SL110]
MDYIKAAFGDFAPQLDENAAIKFALNVVLMDNRLQELAELVVDASQLGGIEGEPGWTLERRDLSDEENEAAYPGWPADMRFKASVNEDAYTLRHPEFFMRREDFMKYVILAVDAYVAADPSRRAAPAVIALRGASM